MIINIAQEINENTVSYVDMQLRILNYTRVMSVVTSDLWLSIQYHSYFLDSNEGC